MTSHELRGEKGEQGERGEKGDSSVLTKHVTRSFVAVVVVFVTVLSVMAYNINSNHNLARDGKQAHGALCALKADYQRRLRDGNQFLADHPNGIPGIKVGVIKTAVANQAATINALRSLRC